MSSSKILKWFLALILVFFSTTGFVFAASFGGKITSINPHQIPEIAEVESANYICNVPSFTIYIKNPQKGPTSYVLAPGAKYKKSILRIGRGILGKYEGKKSIECTNKAEPYDKRTVFLNIIK